MSIKISRRLVLKAGAGTILAAGLPKKIFAGETDAPTEEKNPPLFEALPNHSITHGGIQIVRHPDLETDVAGQTCIRYLRFGRIVEIDHLELGRLVYGRWVPAVPTHPAHLNISMFDRDTFRWKTIQEVDLPAEPEIMGSGLSQQMKMEEIENHFANILKKPPHIINLQGIKTDNLRIICDLEHPAYPNHGECNGGTFNVPFGILDKLEAFGKQQGESLFKMSYNPVLTQLKINPSAPKGMEILNRSDMLLFRSRYLSAGFSLQRPIIMHLGWDIAGSERAALNRLFASRQQTGINGICGTSGPVLRTIYGDYPAHQWSGEVKVEGNRIFYQNLQAVAGLTLDAIFTVEEDRLTLELVQHCDEELPVIDAEIWRLAWDLKKGITGIAGLPTQKPGRNGNVLFPALMAGDGNGCISWNVLHGSSEEVSLQVESYRIDNCISGGIVFGKHPEPDHCQVIPAGTRSAAFELAVTNLEPGRKSGMTLPGISLQRHWATIFSCFRPEYRGFSNNSASVNCHLSQGPPIEIAVNTIPHPRGPKPLDLARFTIEKAILGGGGYGYHRNLYLDSDPVLLSAAGRIHQADPNMSWLKRIEPGLIKTTNRMLSLMEEDGMLISRDLTGNSGSYRWSSNSMDVIGFGHIDGYVNAWAYRAFRNAAALFDDLSNNKPLVERCRQAAQNIRDNYASALLNPETGWIAGWRSLDGKLHDYGFTWVNGVALSFGLVDSNTAQTALLELERKRMQIRGGDARIGIPCNIIPIDEKDSMLTKILNQIQPTFETYIDGSFSAWPATYYLRALSINGLSDHSRILVKDIATGYEEGMFTGGNGSGNEFRSWEGLPTGYEGTLIGCSGPLYALAIEEGVFTPAEPEWWPANG